MPVHTRATAVAAAAIALLGAASAARADYVVNIPGSHVFTRNGGQSVTTPALTGTLTGIRVVFTYGEATGSSWACDVSFTVNQHQWGGYLPFINGADTGERPTGAPDEPNAITFASGNLGLGYASVFENQPVRVGFGNGNNGGGFTVSNVSITLLGVVPTPGAAMALSLGGLAAARRPRRA